MGMNCGKFVEIIEELVPASLAEPWDNQGLLLGDPEVELTGALIALDFQKDVLKEALDLNANFLLVHHPPIFKPLKRLVASGSEGKLLLSAAKAGLNIYAAHTSLDKVLGGVSDALADLLGLRDLEVLTAYEIEKNYKLVVFVPETHEPRVRKAMGDAGAGFIGNYSHCTFRTKGIGTFLPQSEANPYLGQIGLEEEVAEFRLETIVPESGLKEVLKAMLESHPYEEVAYDLYLLNNSGQPKAGLGRLGYLNRPMTWQEFVQFIKGTLSLSHVKVVKGDEPIHKVAVLGGSGGKMIEIAARRGAQALITGDVNYHQGQYAQSLGLTVIDAGHYGTEKVVLPSLKEGLTELLTVRNSSLPIYLSKINTNPWFYY